MAVVGSAEVVVNAITAGFKKQLQQAFRDARPVAAQEGERYGKAFSDKFNSTFKSSFKSTMRDLRPWMKDEGGRQGKLFGASFAKAMRAELDGVFDSAFDGLADAARRARDDVRSGEKITADDLVDQDLSSDLTRRLVEQMQAANEALAAQAAANAQRLNDAQEEADQKRERREQAHQDRIRRIQELNVVNAEKAAQRVDAINAVAAAKQAAAAQAAQDRLDAIAEQADLRRLARQLAAQDKLDQAAEAADLKRAISQQNAQDKLDQVRQASLARIAADDARAANARNNAALRAQQDVANRAVRVAQDTAARQARIDQDLKAAQARADQRRVNEATLAADRAARAQERAAQRASAAARSRSDRDWSSRMRSFEQSAIAANRAFTTLYATGNALGAALTLGVGAVASLGSALVSLAAGASEAAGALVVLPSLLGALVQGAGTGMLAFAGVGEAISAGFAATKSSATGATRATINAGRAIRDANYRIAGAERDLAEAQNEARIAQNALNGARERAIESLQQLGFDVESAALSEERAVLNLQRATEELAQVQANPASTIQELQEASLSYREAELAVRMARDRLEDLEKAQESAAAAGVEGSEEVVQAQNDIIDANERVYDSQIALQRAQEALSDAMQDQASAMSAGASAISKFEEAMAELSPQAQAFVRYIITLKDEIDGLQAAAGEELFPKLTESVREVVENVFPVLEDVLRETGSALGDFALDISGVLSKTSFLERFRTIADDNVRSIRDGGKVVANVIDGISGVLAAAGPIVDRFTSFLVDQSETFQRYATSGSGIEEMVGFFQRAGDAAAQLGEIAGELWDSLSVVFQAALPSGQMLLDKIQAIFTEFSSMQSQAARATGMEDFFNRAAENAIEVMGLIVDLGKLLGSLGADPGVGESASLLRQQWVPVLQNIMDAVAASSVEFAELLVSVTELLAAFADSGSIKVFADVLTAVVDTVTDLVRSGVGRFLIGVVGPLVAINKALAVTKIALSFFGRAAVGGILDMRRSFQSLSETMGVVGDRFGTVTGSFTATRDAMIQNARQATIAGSVVSALGGTVTAANAPLSGFRIGMLTAGAAARTMGTMIWTALGPVGLIMLGITAVVTALGALANANAKAEQRTKDFAASLDQATGALTTDTFDKFADEINTNFSRGLDRVGISVEEYVGYLSDGEQGLVDFEAKLKASGATTAEIEQAMARANEDQESWNTTVENSQEAWAKDNAVKAQVTATTKDFSAAAGVAKAIIKDNEYALKLAEQATELFADRLKETVDNFTLLNDEAIRNERSLIRVHEGQDDLKDSLRDTIDAMKEQEDADWGLINSQEEGLRILDLRTEAGRNARTTILDQMEAIDDLLQSELGIAAASDDVAGATALANENYVKNKESLMDAAEAAGISRDAVEKYIEQIEQTPGEKTTRFTTILEESALTTMIAGLDASTQARLIPMVAELDNPSLDDVLLFLIELGTQGYPVNLTPQMSKDGERAIREQFLKLTLDENGLPRNAEIIPEPNRQKIDETKAKLDGLMTDDQGNPRTVEMLTEAERTTYDQYLKEMNEALIDPMTGKPWAAPIFTEADKTAYQNTIDGLNLLTGNKGNPWIALVTTGTDPNNLKTTRQQLEALAAKQNMTVDVLIGKFIATDKTIYTGTGKLVPVGSVGFQAEGGPIRGPGGPKSDRAGLFALSNGEFVLSAAAVRSLGGLERTDRMHRALKRGQRPFPMAAGGTVRPTSTGTLALLAEAGRAERVDPLDRNGMSAGDRAILRELRRMRSGGMNVTIGSIQTPKPPAAAREIVSAMRAEAYRMGQYR